MNRYHALRTLSTLVTIAVVGCLGSACGDDDEPRVTAGAPTSDDPILEPFCSTIVETFTTTNRAFAQFDFATARPREIGRFLRDMSDRLEPLYQELEAVTPDEIADVAARRLAVARKALRTGIEDDSPEALADEQVLDQFTLDHCDVHRAPTVLSESGIETGTEAPEGVVAFELRNDAAHPAGFWVYAVPSALAAAPLDEVVRGTEELVRVGGSDIGAGESFATFVDLEPGHYLLGDPSAGADAVTELRVG